MKKKDALLIVCSLMAIPTLLAGMWNQYANHTKELQAAVPTEFWKYIDYNFYGSKYFALWITVSSFIVIINLIHFRVPRNTKALKNWRDRANTKIIATALILLGIIFGSTLIVPSIAIMDYTIHVLGVGDEEFDATYSPGFSRWAGWEIYIFSAFDKFRDVYGLTFELVGWISFDSDDAETNPVTRLNEAIRETHFMPFVTTYKGQIIDLLMVFSAQSFDCEGLSVPDWKAMLLSHYPAYPRNSYLCHELSHQFYVEHCSSRGSCCMYPNWEFGLYFPADWCATCRNSLNSNGHKNRFAHEMGGVYCGRGFGGNHCYKI